MEKWEQSGWAKKLAARQVRKVSLSPHIHPQNRSLMTPFLKNASDFDRFQLQLAKNTRRDLVRKAYVKEKKAMA